MNFQGVLLDLDNTLYPYTPAHEKAQQSVLQYLSANGGISETDAKATLSSARNTIHSQLPTQGAGHHRLLYFQKALEKLGLSSFEHALKMDQLYWNTFLKEMRLFDGALEFLQELNRPICLITDLIASIQFQKIERLGLGNILAFMVSSEEAGVEKPHPFPFLLGCHKLGLKPAEVIMIGDNEAKDGGCQNLGIPFFCRDKDFRTFHELKELIHAA